VGKGVLLQCCVGCGMVEKRIDRERHRRMKVISTGQEMKGQREIGTRDWNVRQELRRRGERRQRARGRANESEPVRREAGSEACACWPPLFF
jgi:hypothetical protein